MFLSSEWCCISLLLWASSSGEPVVSQAWLKIWVEHGTCSAQRKELDMWMQNTLASSWSSCEHDIILGWWAVLCLHQCKDLSKLVMPLPVNECFSFQVHDRELIPSTTNIVFFLDECDRWAVAAIVELLDAVCTSCLYMWQVKVKLYLFIGFLKNISGVFQCSC